MIWILAFAASLIAQPPPDAQLPSGVQLPSSVQLPKKGMLGGGLDLWAGVGRSAALYFATPYIGAYASERWFCAAVVSVGQAAFRIGNDSYLSAGLLARRQFFAFKIAPFAQLGAEYGVSSIGMGAFASVHPGLGAVWTIKDHWAIEILAQYRYFDVRLSPDRRGLDAFMVGFGFQGRSKPKPKKKPPKRPT
ncbi:MAG: hypothetical protein NZ534_00910 [Bacteroidia bacterium]|nr:hypothetical protein [Bacteroidia bacterium]